MPVPMPLSPAVSARIALRFLLVAGVLSLAACRGGSDDVKGKANAPVQIISVQLERKPWRDGIEALGTARANESVVIAAKVNETRSEEHTSELQSLMRNSYAVFCLKKNKQHLIHRTYTNQSKNN